MAYVNERERDLYVACLGDCRAVMGVRELLPGGGHVWRAVPLSSDQTGRSKSEIKRLQQEHPGEEDTVVKRGRVLGRLGKLGLSLACFPYVLSLTMSRLTIFLF